jgi:hypothetical protein
MTEFRSWQSYRNFAWSVKRKSRYIFEKDTEDFLQTVLDMSHSRKRNMYGGEILWRAQLGHEWDRVKQGPEEFEVPGPCSPQRMRPLRDSAREGRVNPKGIPCLYLSTDKETAMAEVRPWLGLYVSVGQFKILRDLILVDCSVYHSPRVVISFKELDPDKRERVVWADIDWAFSEPVSPNESTDDYAPTQILSELFRNNGYDGIVYKSLLGEGLNVALFDLDSADLINCSLYEVKSITFNFQEAANPYFISKYYEKVKKGDD